MADVTLSYKGSDILELSDSGSATLKTGGKYCEGDIGVEYVKPSGGGEDLLEKRITNTLTEYRNAKTLTTIQFAFANLTNLEHLFLPNAVFNTQCAQGCSNLLTAVIGRIGGTYALQNCSKLTIVDFALMIANSQISAFAFNGCAKLETILIRNSSITSLASTNVFNGTPFASTGTGGTLYVPQALISDYQNATNWSTILGYANNQILPIEGSYYETHYADGTPIPT